ncbi:hypothetical protein ACFW2V_12840 [Streptomyces sp. NPDC058947]|uniref:hypothetical protein n=1 Tax=Streptomyces sp. NPDC058947 TaxID=3346675 RepID=UPI0036AA9DCC
MKAFFPDFTFVYIDAEFLPDDHSPYGLISLALHSEHGSKYMVNENVNSRLTDLRAIPFQRDHILPKLPLRPAGNLDTGHSDVYPYRDMAEETGRYFHALTGGRKYRRHVGLVADHGTQDMQRIHNLFNNDWFGLMPSSVPRRLFLDLATMEDLAGVEGGCLPDGRPLPEKDPQQAHHPLVDAMWDREVHEFLMQHSRAVRVASGVERLES